MVFNFVKWTINFSNIKLNFISCVNLASVTRYETHLLPECFNCSLTSPFWSWRIISEWSSAGLEHYSDSYSTGCAALIFFFLSLLLWATFYFTRTPTFARFSPSSVIPASRSDHLMMLWTVRSELCMSQEQWLRSRSYNECFYHFLFMVLSWFVVLQGVLSCAGLLL